MASEKFAAVGDCITRGDFDGAVDALVQAGGNDGSFEANAVIAIIGSKTGQHEHALSNGLAAIAGHEDLPAEHVITRGITVCDLWKAIAAACFILDDKPTAKQYFDKMHQSANRMTDVCIVFAVQNEYYLNGFDVALNMAQQYANVPDNEENHLAYHYGNIAVTNICKLELVKHCNEADVTLPQGPVELLKKLVAILFDMLDSVDRWAPESTDPEVFAALHESAGQLGNHWLGDAFTKLANLSKAEGGGYITNLNFSAAKEMFQCAKRGAERGNHNFYYMLGRLYQNGCGTTQDANAAFACMEKAAAHGDPDGLYALAIFYSDGTGTDVDFAKKFECAEKLTEKGDARGWGLLSDCYANGQGVAADREKSIECLKKAAEMGDQKAKEILANTSSNEPSSKTVPDYDRKADFLKSFAEDFNNATRYEEIANSVPEYVKIYQEFEKNNLITLNDRHFFFWLCVSAQQVLFRYTGSITWEYFIEQFDKTLSLMGEQAGGWASAMARDFNGGGGCLQELMSNMAEHDDSRLTNWDLVDEYVCRKAVSLGWDGRYKDGDTFTPDDKRTVSYFKNHPIKVQNESSTPLQPTNQKYSPSPASAPKKSGGCYVATAVYGSYDCPEVWTLRRFRDFSLAKSFFGRAFIKTYYAISPTLVSWFGKTGWFKSFWKHRLDKLVSNLKEQGYEDTPYND